MARCRRGNRKNQWIEHVKQFIKREGPAVFIIASIAAGTMTFFAIATVAVNIQPDIRWEWVALANSVMRLPRVYDELKNSQEPWLIRFAICFKTGFIAPALIAPDLSKWVTKVRGLWGNLHR